MEKIEEFRLMDICPSCEKNNICEYGNKVWHQCEHVKRISQNLISSGIKILRHSEHRCDKCHNILSEKKSRWVENTGLWICYSCYPKTPLPNGKDFY